MIQDIVFRKFVYDDYKWNPTIPGNVERLHNDYRLINSYVIKKYDMKNDVEISMNVEKEEINQICSFGTEQIIADIENDFKLCPKGKIFFFTEAMADKYIKNATESCLREMESLREGKVLIDEFLYAWENKYV